MVVFHVSFALLKNLYNILYIIIYIVVIIYIGDNIIIMQEWHHTPHISMCTTLMGGGGV